MGIVGSILAAAHTPFLLPVVLPVWLLATYGTARTVYRNNARKRAVELEALAQALADLTRELIAERPLLGDQRQR